jgi:hypothetical protein
MRLHAAFAGATCILALLLTPAFAHAAAPTACELLTAQTAAGLAGEAVTLTKDVQGKGCAYATKSGANIGFAITDMAADDAKNYIASMRLMVVAPATTELIPGLGEQNYLLVRPESQKNKNALQVIYHQKLLTLGVQRKMTPDLKAQMVQFMRQVLSKI